MLDKSKSKEGPQQEDLWSSILNDVRTSSTPRHRVAARNLIVVGDVNSGKNAIIDRLRRKDAPNNALEVDEARGCGMEYTYLDVHYEDFDDVFARLGVWILDGDEKYQPLLIDCLNEKNIEEAVCMLVLDLSKPWSVVAALQKWLTVLSEHINSLKIDPKQRKDMEEKQVKLFQSYVEPSDSTAVATTGAAGAATTAEDEKVLLPLGEDVLVANLGIPIVIVATKSDSFTQLEKEEDFSEEHFDFIQMHLRRLCLKYGAALVYASTKDSRNCELLYSYLIHVAYQLPFKSSATVVDRDAIFVPIGWDSSKKIALLQEQITSMSSEDAFEERIVEPPSRKPAQDQVPVTAEADQIFLLRQQAHLGIPSTSGGSAQTRAGEAGVPARTTPTNNSRSPRTDRKPSSGASAAASAAATTAGGGQTGETVLASFFQSLLQKKPVGAAGRGAAGAPGAPAAGGAGAGAGGMADLRAALDKSQPKKS